MLQVQVQRRETERQAEQRVNSYAYIARQEAEEKWKQLNCASADSSVASSLWDKLMTPPAVGVSVASMPRASYLSALTAGKIELPSHWHCCLPLLPVPSFHGMIASYSSGYNLLKAVMQRNVLCLMQILVRQMILHPVASKAHTLGQM